jgi:hypothetical protein
MREKMQEERSGKGRDLDVNFCILTPEEREAKE